MKIKKKTKMTQQICNYHDSLKSCVSQYIISQNEYTHQNLERSINRSVSETNRGSLRIKDSIGEYIPNRDINTAIWTIINTKLMIRTSLSPIQLSIDDWMTHPSLLEIIEITKFNVLNENRTLNTRIFNAIFEDINNLQSIHENSI
ncbi:MAG: hypothetical protein JKX76_01505 [Colwellia sp.]|nr:hypothetical protein [Colwellia sp.]